MIFAPNYLLKTFLSQFEAFLEFWEIPPSNYPLGGIRGNKKNIYYSI
jgi:hypothetical protein